MMHLKTLYAVLLFACIRLQGAEGNLSGYEFVFSVPTVANTDYPHVMITTPLPNPVQTTVTIPGTEFEVDTDVTRNQYADIQLPNSVYLVGTGKQASKTVIVRSAGEASVHVMANKGKSGDGFLVLPTRQLGNEHYVLSYTPHSSYPSFICVCALNKTTTVDILTKAGQTHRVVLGEYESYQLVGGDSEDFSGSRIVSDHAVAVVSGTQCSNVGSGSCDALVEQMPPIKEWGTNVAISPFMGKDTGYMYRVLGTDDTTSITISNVGTVSLTEGQWYEGDITDNTIVTIASDYPILVMQYIKGGGSSMPLADPSMILVPSTNMYTNNITFPVYNNTLSTNIYYIHAIVDCNYVHGLTYDDHISMADWERLTTADGDMCAIRGAVSPGTVHSIGHPDEDARFTVAVYGLVSSGHMASYAYPAGIRGLGTDKQPSTAEPPITDEQASTAEHPITEEQPSTAEPPVTDEHSSTESPFTKPALGNEIVGLDLQCEGTSMRAFFNTSLLPFKQASDVHLRDPDCSATEIGDGWAVISTDYHLCQTQMTETATHIVYRNALVLGPDNPNSIIIPIQKNIECRLERHHVSDTSYSSSVDTHVSYGNFTFELDIFKDDTYNISYGPGDYPVDVKVGDETFLAGRLVTVSELDLFLDSCWGTPTADPWDDDTYVLIENGCAVDSYVTFYDSGVSTMEQFSFRAFAFRDDKWLVFLHCQMFVCDVTTPNSRCSQGCVESNKRGGSRVRRSESELHTVTSGPLVVRG